MKLAAALIAVVVGTSMVAMPASASAGSQREWHRDRSVKKCNYYANQIDEQFERFNQNKYRRTAHLQDWINKSNDRKCAPSEDIVNTLVNSGNFDTLVAAVKAAGLATTLQGDEFTIFAPTDQAFAKLPAGTVESLLADTNTLKSILTYHAVSGSVPAATARTITSAPTVNGKSITISKRHGSLYINDSRVVVYDLKTTNGIIHVIDTVLIP